MTDGGGQAAGLGTGEVARQAGAGRSTGEVAGQGGVGRGTTEITTLLIELGRALKACRFYGAEHPSRKSALDRSFHAFRTGLERGPLEIHVRGVQIHVADRLIGAGSTSIEELARELRSRGVERLRLDEKLTREAFGVLADALALDPDELTQTGGVERVAAGCADAGVAINAPGDEHGSGVAAEAPGPERELEAPPTVPVLPRAAERVESLTESEGPAELPDLWPSGESDESDPDADLPAERVQTTDMDPLHALDGMLQGVEEESQDGALAPEPEGDRGAELVGGLRNLDEARDDEVYEELLRGISADAASLADARPCDDSYRALLVLSSHATDLSRSDRQRGLAEEALFGLASGARLQDVIQRACETGPLASVRATQILLHLGAHAVPGILDALLGESDPERRGQLNAILIAMGEKALPEVKASLELDDPERARLATRLAGEMQNPACVPYLSALVRDPQTPVDLVREAAKALVRVGNPAAIAVLLEAVSNPRAELAEAAAFCLGASGSPKALEALVAALRRALREDQDDLAREVIRALGRLGRPEAAPALEEIISRRSLLGRRRLRELKVAATNALARLPGDQPRKMLRELAEGRGDQHVRRTARAALSRPHAQSRSEAAGGSDS